jgi:glucose dehydrogenase
MLSITSAPTIVRGVIVTGHQVLDGQRRDAPSGVIQGYDAVTGALRWAWDMARPDITGPAARPARPTRKGTPNMWTTATGDEALGLVYLPLGNSAADYWSSSRSPLEKQYSTSLVALDVTTGKPPGASRPCTTTSGTMTWARRHPGRLPDRRRAGPGRGAAQQAGRHLRAGPPHRPRR